MILFNSFLFKDIVGGGGKAERLVCQKIGGGPAGEGPSMVFENIAQDVLSSGNTKIVKSTQFRNGVVSSPGGITGPGC